MRSFSSRFSPLALAAVIVAAPATAFAQETETVDRTIALPANGTLDLKNFSGRVNITGGSGNDVVIKAVRTARRDRLDRIKLTIETSGSTVTVNANDRTGQPRARNRGGDNEDNNNVVRTDFDITVPASARLNIDVFSSDVTVRGVTGRQVLHTFSGDIDASDVRGAIEAETFSGTIEIDATASGKTPEISAETFSGSLRIRLAGDAAGRVEFDSFSGSLDSDLPISMRTSGRRRVIGELPGGAGRTIRLETFSGSARIIR
jgi:DUF4097 and DUF4098 domain-containing protein YvlB